MNNNEEKKSPEVKKVDNKYVAFLKEVRDLIMMVWDNKSDVSGNELINFEVFKDRDVVLGNSDINNGTAYLNEEDSMILRKGLGLVYDKIKIDLSLDNMRNKSDVRTIVHDLCLDIRVQGYREDDESLKADFKLMKVIERFGKLNMINKTYVEGSDLMCSNKQLLELKGEYLSELQDLSEKLESGELYSVGSLNNIEKELFIDGLLTWSDMRNNKLGGGLSKMTETEMRRRVVALTSILNQKIF